MNCIWKVRGCWGGGGAGGWPYSTLRQQRPSHLKNSGPAAKELYLEGERVLGRGGGGEGGNAAVQNGERPGEPLLVGGAPLLLLLPAHQLLSPGDQRQPIQPVVVALAPHL
jgi:hypothetical protein